MMTMTMVTTTIMVTISLSLSHSFSLSLSPSLTLSLSLSHLIEPPPSHFARTATLFPPWPLPFSLFSLSSCLLQGRPARSGPSRVATTQCATPPIITDLIISCVSCLVFFFDLKEKRMILHYSSLMSLRFKCAIETKKIIEKLKEGNIDPSYRFSQMKEQREQIEKWKPHGNNILYSYSHYYVEFGTRTSSLVLVLLVYFSKFFFTKSLEIFMRLCHF